MRCKPSQKLPKLCLLDTLPQISCTLGAGLGAQSAAPGPERSHLRITVWFTACLAQAKEKRHASKALHDFQAGSPQRQRARSLFRNKRQSASLHSTFTARCQFRYAFRHAQAACRTFSLTMDICYLSYSKMPSATVLFGLWSDSLSSGLTAYDNE